MPDNVSVAKPASGTYGEDTAVQDLKQSLPVGAIGNPAPTAAPAPPAMSPEPATPQPNPVGRPAMPTPPPGIPAAILAPTDRPNVPASTSLAEGMPAGPGIADPRQARMAILDALVNDPNVGEETRQWARTVQSILLRG